MYIELTAKLRKVLTILFPVLFLALVGTTIYTTQGRMEGALSTEEYHPTETTASLGKIPQSTQPPDITVTPLITIESKVNPTRTITANTPPVPTLTPIITATPVCGGPPQMTILALGIDRRQSGYDYGLADAIRLVRADFNLGEVTVLTLPRDLWVTIPGLEEKGILEGKLNQAYYYGSEYYGMYDDPDYGPGLMAVTLELNYGLQIDRYLAVNMQALEEIIDAVGGIDINLPYAVDGKSTDPEDPFDLGHFSAGRHHFDGETTLRFARIRMMDNDYQRTTRQSLVLQALWEKVVSPSILPKVPQLISILSDSVQMNLRAEDMPPMVCLAALLDEERLRFEYVPLEMLHETRIYVPHIKNTVFAYQVDRGEFSQFLDDFQRGVWPAPGP